MLPGAYLNPSERLIIAPDTSGIPERRHEIKFDISGVDYVQNLTNLLNNEPSIIETVEVELQLY